jgi:hypothetical protein
MLLDIEIIYARSDEKINATDIFEQIKIVPIETTDSSLVGLFIDDIKIWNNKMFIENNLQSHVNILCCDMSGKFLFKIDRMGQGPGEYTYLDNFFIDENLNHLVFFSEHKRILHFDMQGNFLYDIHTKDEYYARHSIYLNDSTYLSFIERDINNEKKEEIALLYIDSRTANIRHKTNPVNEYVYFISQPLCSSNDRILCLTHNDLIYEICDIDSAKAKYTVYYSDKNIDIKNKFKDKSDKMTWEEKLEFEHTHYSQKEIISIYAIHETDRFLALSCWRPVYGTGDHVRYIIFYDKHSKKTYDSENINFGGLSFDNFAVAGAPGDELYCVLYSILTAEDKQKIKNNSALSDENKRKFLEHQEEDNPLLFVLK